MPVALPQIVHVVRAHERQIELLGQRHETGVHDPLLVDALVLHLEEEVPRPEDVAIARRRLERLARLVGANPRRHLAFQAAAEADEPARVRREQLFVDARLVVEPVRVAGRHELDEVVESLVRFRKEDEVVRRFTRLS